MKQLLFPLVSFLFFFEFLEEICRYGHTKDLRLQLKQPNADRRFLPDLKRTTETSELDSTAKKNAHDRNDVHQW